jgi:hypothetical protein
VQYLRQILPPRGSEAVTCLTQGRGRSEGTDHKIMPDTHFVVVSRVAMALPHRGDMLVGDPPTPAPITEQWMERAQHRSSAAHAEALTPSRRLALLVTATLHSVVAGLSGLALSGLPRVAGIPVLRGPGTGPALRAKLEAALTLLHESAPGRLGRLRRHVLGIFLSRQPYAHGHYSRITGTCTLDLERLAEETPVETAAALVRCATEAWLWRAGRGRAPEDEDRILALGERARQQFVRRVQAAAARGH